MNKNDKKATRPTRGLVDPRSVKEWKVYKETTLMEFLLFKLGEKERKTVKSLLSHHQVAVGGVMVSQFDYKIYPEDVVTVSERPIRRKEVKRPTILYEDENIIAIDKPSGLLSVATEREKGKTAYRIVSDYIAAKSPKSRIFVVHRLDEDTSGVLVFAKNIETREALQNAWQEVVTKRFYYAIVEGKMEEPSGTFRDYLAQDNFQLVYVTKNKTKGKLAVTSYKVLDQKGPYSLLDVSIASGRKNQIRVQLGSRGHYVIGDDKYGEPTDPLKRLGLHAYELAFTHPLTGKSYDIKSPLPKDFKALFSGAAISENVRREIVKKEQKDNRLTRRQTKIENGKKRREALAARYGGVNKKKTHGKR